MTPPWGPASPILQYSGSPHVPLSPGLITLESAVASSRAVWTRDLRALFEHAKDRFGDVRWTDEEIILQDGTSGLDRSERVDQGSYESPSIRTAKDLDDDLYAHKAIVHARAPKGFKDRYFSPGNSLTSPSLLNGALCGSYTEHSTASLPIPLPPINPRDQNGDPHDRPPSSAKRDRAASRRDRYRDTLSGSPVIGQRVSSLPLKGSLLDHSGPSRPDSRAVSRTGTHTPTPGPNPHSRASGMLELSHNGTPELVRANLEWLYTSEGMGGDVVEWLNGEEVMYEPESSNRGEKAFVGLGMGLGEGVGGMDEGDNKASRRLSRLGRESERHEKLSQDLVYMWRSKLYADVKIRLQVHSKQGDPSGVGNDNSLAPPSSFRNRKPRSTSRRSSHPSDDRTSVATSYIDDSEAEGDEPRDKNGNIMAFSAHRFMLCSRSPYFAQVLLNSGAFAYNPAGSSVSVDTNQIPEILLPTPPFTPIALHFVLGYIYSGSLDFSHRTFDLSTAFAVYRAAIFLEIDPLLAEVEARIIWEFCDGMPLTDPSGRPESSNRKKRARRIARVWRFALASDVGAVSLGSRASLYVVAYWGECLGKEVAQAEETVRNRLVDRVSDEITAETVVAGFAALLFCRGRLDAEKPSGTSAWEVTARSMTEEIQESLQRCLVRDAGNAVNHPSFLLLLDPMRSKGDVLQSMLDSLGEGCGRPDLCEQAPLVYQAVVGSLLTGTQAESEDLILPRGSRYRDAVEETRVVILGHIKRRWMHIKTAKAFSLLEYWALKEISDEIEVEVQDLLESERRLRVSGRSQMSLAPDDATKPSPAAGRVAALKIRHTVVAPSPGSMAAAARLRLASSSSRASGLSARTTVEHTAAAVEPKPAAVAKFAVAETGAPSLGAPIRAETASSQGHPYSQSSRSDPAEVSAGAGRMMPSAVAPGPSAAATHPLPSRLINAAPPRSRLTSTMSSVATSPRRLTGTQPRPGLVADRLRTFSASSTASSMKAPLGRPVHAAGGLSADPTRTAVPKRLQDDGASIRSNGTTSSFRKVPLSSGGAVVRETATSRARANLAQKPQTRAAGQNSDAKSLKAGSVRSVATGRSVATSMRPKTPVAEAATRQTPSTATPPRPASSARPVQRPLAKESSVTSLKSLRLKPVPKVVSSLAPVNRQRTQPDASPTATPKTPTKGKTAMKTVFPSPAHDMPSPPKVLKEASASTDGDISEARTPIALDAEDVLTPHIFQPGSHESENGLEPSLEEILGSRPQDRMLLGKTSFRKPSLPLPPDRGSFERSYTRMRASSTTSSIHSHSHPAHAFDPPPRPLASPIIRISDDNSLLQAGTGVGLQVGIPCIVALAEPKARFKALCRYIGRLEGLPGPWVGVEIAEYVGVKYGLEGLGDGDYDGVRYFYPTVAEPDSGVRRTSNLGGPGESHGIPRKSSMPTRTLRRSDASRDDGPLSASFAGSFGPSRLTSRSASPVPGYTSDVGNANNWIQGAFGPANGRTRSLFVQPGEVVFVLGAAD